ncbi:MULTISPECIES: hypothetical protein [Streptosporangium]|uniref:Uncharacterized protein n=1 Tax=Streptosporangium brasiliense TaxID=47480 RepID=A0ABT9R7D1_9ACTN|nr:hypothetical protein [Streptosporangium brasiliense]MDP9865152.1 hypothetical protein [Streptosporangium brasiliense]
MNFCLSDLVPPLRWSDAATIPLLRDRPGLPDAWWRSLPMARVLAVLEPEELAEILARIALEHWPAAAVGDVLPALYVLDPDEADEPCTAIALDRAGSWAGLLSLTGHELRDQPFIQPYPVLNVLFAAVFHRVAHPGGAAAPVNGAAAAAAAGRGAEHQEAAGAAPAGAAALTSGPEPAAEPEPAGPEPATAPEPAAAAVAGREPAAGTEPTADQEPERVPAPDAGALPDAGDSPDAGALPDAGDSPEAGAVPEAGDAPAPHAAVPAARAALESEEVPAPGREPDQDPDPGREPDADQEPVAASAGVGREARRPAESVHALVDGAFANLEDKSWAIAQNRLFSDEPATVEALAKLFAVQPEVIRELEDDLRLRFAAWLGSEEAAPYREHLAEVKRVLGKAAPKTRLITAADWHEHELHSLDVPAWQFVLASLPEYHLVDEWLVEGDITELRHHTRDVISGAKPPLTMTKALALVTSLGIHPEVSKEWLENVPQLRILGAGQRANGSAAKVKSAEKAKGPEKAGSAERTMSVEKAELPGRSSGPPGGEAGKAPFRPLKDVSLTRRCFRQPDGRWWLRIDITPEHLQGAECPLPSGFAAYLGMSPGGGRTVTSAVGELTLSWRERPVVESLRTLLADVGAKQGSHLFLTLSDEGVLRARHLPAAGKGVEPTAQALRLVGYTAPGGTPEQAGRVIATRIGMTGPVGLPDLLVRLRERGDRDLLSLLA